MADPKQTSDAENMGNKAAGTNTTSLTPNPAGTSAPSISPSGNPTSGSSQDTKRGPQGMGK